MNKQIKKTQSWMEKDEKQRTVINSLSSPEFFA